MKAYKGFTKEMMCRGFKFEEGETYHENKAELCKCGFHACEYPLDCFSYYSPAESVFHSVDLTEVDETREEDTKISGKTIKIGARLDIMGIIKASIEYITSRTDKNNSATGNWSANSATGDRSANSATGYGSANSATGNWSANSATGNWSANSATGYGSANSATGYGSANSATGNWSANSATGYGSANSATGNWSANSATGDRSANSATGYGSANSATGYGSANSATGDRSANSATGDRSANSATGDRSANSATGYGSANVSTGNSSKNHAGNGSISVGWGKDNKCKGDLGAYIVLVERGNWDGEKHPQIGEPKLGKIDGEILKADTWYTLKNGEFIEVAED